MTFKILIYYRLVRYFWCSMLFNFKYFPFKTALTFPVVFYSRPRFISLKGKVELGSKPHFRMINLGYPGNSMKTKKGEVFWENNGGTVIFKGKFSSNPDLSIKLSQNAILTFGNNCSFGQNNLISCKTAITFGNYLLSSWDNQFFDNDFHRFYSIEKHELIPESKAIVIDSKVFIGSRCTILKGTSISFRSVVSSNSVLNKNYGEEIGTLISGNPATIQPRKLTLVVNEPMNYFEYEELQKLWK